MDTPYYLEKMMIERMQEVERQAELRTRLGLRHRRAEATPSRVRRLVGGWLIQAGALLLRANPDSETVMERMTEGPPSGTACHGGQNGRATNSQ